MIKLYELRKERGLSQDEIAKILNVKRQSYSRYERGEHELGYEALNKLSKFFDVSIDYLLGNSVYFYPDRISDIAPMGESMTADERELLQLYRGLSPYLQGMTMEAVRSWAKKGSDGERKKV